eukprot:764767-Hanusia_phi.AAC.5
MPWPRIALAMAAVQTCAAFMPPPPPPPPPSSLSPFIPQHSSSFSSSSVALRTSSTSLAPAHTRDRSSAAGRAGAGAGARMLALLQMSSQEVGPAEGKCSIPPPPALKNVYFGIRHGHSVNNLEELISSSPPVGTSMHPLTEQGVTQAREAGRVLAEELRRLEETGKTRRVVAYTSDVGGGGGWKYRWCWR